MNYDTKGMHSLGPAGAAFCDPRSFQYVKVRSDPVRITPVFRQQGILEGAQRGSV